MAKIPMYQRRATSTRRAKLRSAEDLRKRVLEFLKERGGVAITEPAFHGRLCVLGGDVRLPLKVGALVVHLPSDDDLGVGLSINTRFTEDAVLPSDANPYSGKWNSSHYDDEEELFRVFTNRVERLPWIEG